MSPEQKQAAVDAVLGSQTFARAQQLKTLLRYVCEADLTGRGGTLNEYMIGVEALGRPADFSPTEDAIVRNRAHALRQRLEEYYRTEGRADLLRIDVPRGSYCPRFVPAEAAADTGQAAPPRRRRLRLVEPLGFALAGVAAGALLASIWWDAPSVRAPATVAAVGPIVRDFWGPLLAPGANVLVAVAAPGHVMLRAVEGPPPDRLWPPVADMERWYRETSRTPVPERARVYLYPYWSSPVWGDSVAAMSVVATLAAAGASHGVMPERVLSLHATRGRNLVLVGNPEFSEIVRHFLARAHYSIGYDAEQREWTVLTTAAVPEGERLPLRTEIAEYVVYGLITVVPSEGAADGEKRTVVLSGVGSAGTQAAAEFFASEAGLAVLRDRFRQEGLITMPRAYQVVVETTAESALPLTVRYHRHRVLSR